MTTAETQQRMQAHSAALKRLGMTEADCIRICAKIPTETMAGARELYWALPHVLEAYRNG